MRRQKGDLDESSTSQTVLEFNLWWFLAQTEPRLTGPRSPKNTVLRHQVECNPCFLSKCPLDFHCMHAVAPEEAANAILELIQGRR